MSFISMGMDPHPSGRLRPTSRCKHNSKERESAHDEISWASVTLLVVVDSSNGGRIFHTNDAASRIALCPLWELGPLDLTSSGGDCITRTSQPRQVSEGAQSPRLGIADRTRATKPRKLPKTLSVSAWHQRITVSQWPEEISYDGLHLLSTPMRLSSPKTHVAVTTRGSKNTVPSTWFSR